MKCEDAMVISAALDGERVDLGTLRGALAGEDDRKMLASFVLLRAEIAADDICPSRSLHIADIETASSGATWAARRRLPAGAQAEPSWHHRLVADQRARISVVAALASLAMACAFWFGTVWQSTAPQGAASRMVGSHVPPADAGSADLLPGGRADTDRATSVEDQRFDGSSGPSQRTLPAEPPKATRVLRYLPGTDWRPGSF
jgi:hypothetical protein